MSECFSEFDQHCMRLALEQAELSVTLGEVPVGAVMAYEGEVIAKAHNQPIGLSDPSAHAEILVMRKAAEKLKNYRLLNTVLYVTLEPCVMCAGAIVHARVGRVVYAASDPKAGAVNSKFNLLGTNQFNFMPQCQGGLFQKESAELLKNFFKARRK